MLSTMEMPIAANSASRHCSTENQKLDDIAGRCCIVWSSFVCPLAEDHAGDEGQADVSRDWNVHCSCRWLRLPVVRECAAPF